MPSYLITDNVTGRQFKVTGDSPPTEQELAQIFSDMGGGGPSNNPADYPQKVNKADAEKMRQQFYDTEASTGTKVRDTAKAVTRTAMPYVRPVMEAGGAIGGAIAGGGATPAALLGAGLGYGIGAKTADIIEDWSGAPSRVQPQSTTGQLLQSAEDVLAGATMEAGGQLAGKGISYLAGKAKNLKNMLPDFSEAGVKRKAGQILSENMGDAAQYEANAAAARDVETAIPGYKTSLGEQRNDPALIKLQRGLERTSGQGMPAANLLAEQRAGNMDALKMHLADRFPGEDDILNVAESAAARRTGLESAVKSADVAATEARNALPTASTQRIGADILGELETQAEPIKATMREMGDAIPNYPLATDNLNKSAANFAGSRLITIQERRALKPILDDIAARTDGRKMGLKELQTVQRNINDVISKDLEGKASTDLMALKSAIQNDLDEFSKLTTTGQIKDYNGKLINVDQLANEFEQNALDLARLGQKTEPDYGAMIEKLKAAGVDRNIYSKVDRYDGMVNSRIEKEYQKRFGEIPYSQTASDSARARELTARQQQISTMLDKADPALDAAARYRAYNRFANQEYFNRFERGATGRVTRRGSEASGTQTQLANIAQQFARPDGADDLIRAVGPDRAAEMMDQYFAHDLLRRVNPGSGELSASSAQTWLRDNLEVLKKYGLTAKYDSLAQAQASVEMAREAEKQFGKSAAAKLLNADPEKALEAAFQTYPKNTARTAGELMELVKDNPQALNGLQTAMKDMLWKRAETTLETIAGDKALSFAALEKELDRFEPALQVIYRDTPEKLRALHDVQNAVKISARSSRSPIGGGSDTAENASAIGVIRGALQHVPGVPASMKLIGKAWEWVNGITAQEANNLLARAMYDPELAQALINAAKGKIAPEAAAGKFSHYLYTAGLVTARGQVQRFTPEEIRQEMKRRGY